MWQPATPNHSPHHKHRHRPRSDPISHASKHFNPSFTKGCNNKYPLQTHTNTSKLKLNGKSRTQANITPIQPPKYPILCNNSSSDSIRSTFTCPPSRMLPSHPMSQFIAHSLTPTPQINANTHLSYPSTVSTFHPLPIDKRRKSNVPLQQSSIPPPPQPQSSRSKSFQPFHTLHSQSTSNISDGDIFAPYSKPEQYLNRQITRIEIDDVIIEEDIDEDEDEMDRESMRGCQDTIKSIKRSKDGMNLLDINDAFWEQNNKIPYIGLAMMLSTFIILIFIYFTNLYRLLFGGLIPCVISIIIIIPIYYFFRKYDVEIQYKSDVIADHIKQEEIMRVENDELITENDDLIKQNENLANDLLKRWNEIKKQKKKIQDLNEEIIAAKQQRRPSKIMVNNNCPQLKKQKTVKKCSLLHGFRKGQMEIQLELADVDDLVHMLPIVTSCITLLPFGMHERRKKLQRILYCRISNNGNTDIKRLYGKHKIMKLVNDTSVYYNYEWNSYGHININGDRIYSRKNSIFSDQTLTTNQTDMVSPRYCDDIISYPINNKYRSRVRVIDDDEDDDESTVIYTERDPVKLFRLPLDNGALPGFRVIVAKKLQNEFYDPINGNKCVQQLFVKKIFNSNARPYLIECYINDSSLKLKLSSSYILKRGDDLRKDGAVLAMFEFMNVLWKTHDLKYKDCFIKSLTYKCIPIGPDIGIIEMIKNCIELNKILSLKEDLVNNRSSYNQLIASSAGAFIASFVCGIRDRHDDNILITNGHTLFHIDFGYIFGDRLSLDTAKFAITSDLKKIFNINKNGWNEFLNICIKSWLILRNNASELIDYARVVFPFLYETNQIEMFLRTSLKLDIINDEIATKYIHDKLKNAPKHLKTKMKNLVHGFAQKIKSTD